MSLRARWVLAVVVVAALHMLAGTSHAAGVSMVMSSAPVWDPVREYDNPLVIPGAHLAFSIAITNDSSINIDYNSLIVSVPVPSETAIVVAGGMAQFSAAGVEVDYGGPSAEDDVEFSADGGLNFDYTPSPLDLIDPAVTHVRFRCRGSLAAGAKAQIDFRIAVVGEQKFTAAAALPAINRSAR